MTLIKRMVNDDPKARPKALEALQEVRDILNCTRKDILEKQCLECGMESCGLDE